MLSVIGVGWFGAYLEYCDLAGVLYLLKPTFRIFLHLPVHIVRVQLGIVLLLCWWDMTTSYQLLLVSPTRFIH